MLRTIFQILAIFATSHCQLLFSNNYKKAEEELKRQDLITSLIWQSYSRPTSYYSGPYSNYTNGPYTTTATLSIRQVLGFKDGKVYAESCYSSLSSNSSNLPSIAYFDSDLKATSYYKGFFSNRDAFLTSSGEIYFASSTSIRKLPANPNDDTSPTTIYTGSSTIYKVAKDPSET